MNKDKLRFRISLLRALNDISNFYTFKDTKKIIKYFSNFDLNNKPLWAYSYSQGFFITALKDLEY